MNCDTETGSLSLGDQIHFGVRCFVFIIVINYVLDAIKFINYALSHIMIACLYSTNTV